MSEQLCSVEPCYVKGRHVTDDGPCTTDGCDGCLPGLAADGALVCSWHHRWGVKDLQQLPTLDRDLGTALVRYGSGVKPYSSVAKDSIGLDLDEHAFEQRDRIRSALANLAGFIATERGITGPDGTVTAMSAFLVRHAEWMSANRVLAPIWTRQVRNLVTDARRTAYRVRNTSIKLGDCPLTAPDGSICGEPVRHDPSDYAGQNVTCRKCGHTGTVDEWQTLIYGDDEAGRYLTDDAMSALLTTRYNRVVPPSTIRNWASKEKITRHKVGPFTVYDVAEVRAHADTVYPRAEGATA